MNNKKYILPILFVTLLLDVIGIGMVIPIIPIIFTDPSSPSFILDGYTPQMQIFIAGLITALFGFMQFLAAPLLGELSDVYGRKKILTLTIGVLALAQLLFGFGIEMGLLWLLFLSRIIAGLAGANFSIAQAVIADVSAPEERAKNFGLIGAAFGIGFVLGPVLSGWAASLTNDPALPFWIASGLGIVNLLFISFFLQETNHNRVTKTRFTVLKGIQNIKTAFLDVDAKAVYMASLLFSIGFAFFTTFSGLLLVQKFGLSEAEIGTYFGVVGFWIIITQVFILRIVTGHYTERKILFVTLLLLFFSLGAFPFMKSILFVYVLIPFIAVPVGLSMANMTALISKGVSSTKQGAALGINSSLGAFAQGITPLISGIIGAFFGLAIPFILGAITVLSAWMVLFVNGNQNKKIIKKYR